MAAAPSSARKACRDVNPAGGTATPNCLPTTPQSRDRQLPGRLFRRHALSTAATSTATATCSTPSASLAPSQTQTNRYGLIAGLRCDINDEHTRPRQLHATIAAATARPARPASCSSMASRSTSSRSTIRSSTSNGTILQKRDRRSIALLHQISGEYRGEFFDGRADRQCRHPRAVLHARPDQQLRHVERQRLRRMSAPRRGSPPIWRTTRRCSIGGGADRRRSRARRSASSTITRSCPTSASSTTSRRG